MMEHTEKIAYLKALIYIATADDTIDESEREKFSQLGHIYGLNEDEINSIADSVINKSETLEEILGNISTRQTKLLLVYDLLAICYAREHQLLKLAVQTDFMQQLGHFLVERFQLFIFRVEYLLGRIFSVQQSVRIETKLNKRGEIFLCFVLAAHLLVQIKHHALIAVRGADILRQTFLGMICRVRIKTAGIHTF